jgi:MFS family permease
MPVYSICMAHINDHLNRTQVVAASGTLVLILAAGMTLGPKLGGIAIEQFGPAGIFYLFSFIATMTVMTALFRLWNSPAATENRVAAVAVSANLTPGATILYPKASERSDRQFD